MSEAPTPYLGRNTTSSFSRGEILGRWLWLAVQSTLFRWSPRPLHGFRAALLRLFGARIDGPVVIFPTARVTFPAKLTLAPRSMVGPYVNLYNLAPIRLETGANLSQFCHLCAGSHDFTRWSMPLVTGPIVIGANAWLGADVFVGPGVTIGELAVVGARAVVVNDLPARQVCVGSPCRPIRERSSPS